MRTWVLRIRYKDRPVLAAIKSGKKSIETRALGPTRTGKNFRNIKKGDAIIFRCGDSVLRKRVKKVKYYKSVESLFRKLDMNKVMPYLNPASLAAVRKIYYGFGGYRERIRKYGLVAFWI
ncbi:MAG: hypothetical protein HY456_01275 [Parcubacteria group bacterium]|nr:hypothetical protein [Parcubacteria group bacterium]